MEQVFDMNAPGEFSQRRSFSTDTAFVLFFLALEFGRSFSLNEADWILAVLVAITLAMLMLVPYFLPSFEERPEFGKWVRGRFFLGATAFVSGLVYGRAAEAVFPELFRFLPMTLLIISAIISGCVQFYGIMKVRLAR
ncbi:MAG TPA: hypothetical protein DEA22_04605 [Blastocatellia bacterium]|nr:hypothetical protein [Blastocatellia bacterium]